MEVLNNIALPQSTEHFHLLLFIYNIVMAVLLPYAALLTGSILLSVWADRKGDAPGADGTRLLARRLVTAILPSRTFFTFFAVLPALATVFVYAQVLQGTPALATGFAVAAVLLLVAAGIAGFAYHYTFRLAEAFDPGQPGSDAAAMQAGAVSTHRKSGTAAAWTIVIASFCLSAAMAIGISPVAWTDITSIFGALISVNVWLAWLLFLSLAAAMTGSGILFFHHRSGSSALPGSAYDLMLRSLAVRLLTGAILITPVVLALCLLRLEDLAVSGWVYALASLAVFSLFGALHALYAFVRLDRAATATYAFVLVVVATTFLASMFQVALHNATRDHAVRLAVVYDRTEEALKTALGVGAKPLTGEDIFNAKCSACHTFDQKKVGPAYKNVIPKYQGKKTDLIRFVLNPQKVDPAFPPMPSQGLRPAEADSIVSYLMKKVGVKGS
jgi:cytochrome c